MEKDSFEERIKKARKEAAERKAKMSEEELEELKKASRRHSKKAQSEIETSFEIDKRKGQTKKFSCEEE